MIHDKAIFVKSPILGWTPCKTHSEIAILCNIKAKITENGFRVYMNDNPMNPSYTDSWESETEVVKDFVLNELPKHVPMWSAGR